MASPRASASSPWSASTGARSAAGVDGVAASAASSAASRVAAPSRSRSRIRAAKGGDPFYAARAGFELAKLRTTEDPVAARRLAVAAQAELALVRRRDPGFTAEVDGWLEAHP